MHQTLTAQVTLNIAGKTRVIALHGPGLKAGDQHIKSFARYAGWLRWGAKDFIPHSLVFVTALDWR
jgi:hypothetical protein